MADISKITTLDGTTYNIKDATARSSVPSAATAAPLMDGTAAVGTSSKYAKEDHVHPYDTKMYRKGDAAVHKVSSVSADPQHVALIENKGTLEWMQTIRAIAGVGDWFYAAHLNPEYTITCNYSGAHGTKGNFAISTLFSPSGASTTLLDVSSIAQTPFVLTITKTNGTNITATDVVHLELYTHTLGNTSARLTDYKVELYTTGSTASSGTYSWQTVYQRSGVSDNPSGLVIPLNSTSYSYLYFSGIRFTISGATPGSTNTSAWNYNCLDLTLFRLVDQRPAFSAARSIGALDISGGSVYGYTTFTGGLAGSLTGNASTATNATKVNNHTVNADVPSGAKFTDTTYTASTTKLVTTTVPNVTSVGSAPTLGTAIAADDITSWSAGTVPTLGTAIAADDITAWSAGTVPTLGTAISADDITAWSAGTAASASVSGGVLTITNGTAPSLSYTARSIPNVTDVGTAPSLSYTARSIPNVTDVGTAPSLSYTARSIPNVTSVGSAPTLGTAITVATGSVASNGGGATVATGITAN